MILPNSYLTEVPVLDENAKKSNIEIPTKHEEIVKFIHNCYNLKPAGLQMKKIVWKYLIRSVLRGDNVMMTGHSGTGKTISVKAVQSIFNRPTFDLNMGSTQDPRTSLVGITQFKKETGTYFNPSYFVQAITTPNAIILLDEISRADPEAWNILMSVIDPLQRYLRLDEQEGTPTINVAPGVTFISTANIGSEYTSTRTFDKAFFERWTTIEMPVLNKTEELVLLKYLYPSVSVKFLDAIASFAYKTREEINTENPQISHFVATRQSIKMASLIFDGFSMEEAADVIIYPLYSTDGGNTSERVYIKQILQEYIPPEGTPDNIYDTDTGESTDAEGTDGLFTAEEIEKLSKLGKNKKP